MREQVVFDLLHRKRRIDPRRAPRDHLFY